MADTAKDRWTTEFRQQITAFWSAHSQLLSLSSEFSARGWSGNVSDQDISDQNYDVTAQGVSDALGSVAAVETLMAAGHRTNVTKMVKR